MKPQLRMAIISHISHGNKSKIQELLKLTDEELKQELDKHSQTCPILKRKRNAR